MAESLGEFNQKVKKMLISIIHAARPGTLSDVKYFQLNMNKCKGSSKTHYGKDIVCCSSSEEDFIGPKSPKSSKNSDSSLEQDPTFGYYWAEFTYNDPENNQDNNQGRYKICMFYKDIDKETGNVHVFPGFVQVKKKRDKQEDECFVEEHRAIFPKNPKKTRIPYYEEGWGPIFSDIESSTIEMVWNPEKLSVPTNFWTVFPNNTPSNKESTQSGEDWVCASENPDFHDHISNIGYLKEWNNAKGMYQTLYGWQDDKKKITCITHYKFIYVEEEGYFIVFENNHYRYPNKKEFVLHYDEVVYEGQPPEV